jgi:mono/diheme cytochrome c family protein
MKIAQPIRLGLPGVLLALAVLGAGGLGNVAAAGAKTMVLPPDVVMLRPSALPGYAKAQDHCVACHSAEYLQYQPPTAPRGYWEAIVKRMRGAFKAPLDDADIPDIVDYLVKTYGAEQPK